MGSGSPRITECLSGEPLIPGYDVAAKFTVTYDWKRLQLSLSRQPPLLVLFQHSQHSNVMEGNHAYFTVSLTLTHIDILYLACPLSLYLGNPHIQV